MIAADPGPRSRDSESACRKRKQEHGTHCSGRGGRRDTARKAKRRRTGGGDETRRWVYSPRDFSSFTDKFVIVSYNTLGVENASKHLDLYNQVSPQHLSWDQRKKRIHEELILYNPSILCFQEVDCFNDLADLLHKDGYVGVYKSRTGEANDGCAMFWKEEQFTLLHQENIEFRKFGLRENVAQLCLLKVSCRCSKASTSKDANSQAAESLSGQTLLVGNIHVLFNPNRGDIKLGQGGWIGPGCLGVVQLSSGIRWQEQFRLHRATKVRVLLEKAHTISREWGNTPLVISGDLNSMPESAVYEYLSSSELDILRYDRKKISGQIEFKLNKTPFAAHGNALRSPVCMPKLITYKWSEEEIRLASGHRGCTRLLNPMKLFSAYRGVPGNPGTRDNNGEPLVTSYHSKFMGTVDYIWHSAALSPVRVIETLPIHVLKKLGGLPSEKWGSDHLALVCEFAFVDDANNYSASSKS